MKASIVLGGILLAGLAVDASAQCSGTLLSADEVFAALGDHSITAVSPTTGEEWKEDHCSNGDLYRVGTLDSPPKYPDAPSVDPRRLTGSWSVASDGGITYQYYRGTSTTVGFVSGPFQVYQDGETLHFCTNGSEIAYTTFRVAASCL